jgi:SpoVK/Ycf46/Vps4 family AAA+-type ATPase
VFIGNPGTGKTTVARLVGKLFKTAGLLRRGHCVETSRADLVAGYVGQTAIKTRQILQAALDGVLFIDEAYSLNRGDQNDFGKEAIDTLVKFISDHPGRLMVILAGYRDETLKLINSNPGLKSRFSHWIDFPDFSEEELGEIFIQAAHKSGYKVTPHLVERVIRTLTLQKQKENEHFGNARSVLSLLDATKNNLAQRIYQKYGPSINPSEIPMDEITSITEEDLMEIN